MTIVPDDNRYGVRVEDVEGSSWRVVIVDPGGGDIEQRACSDEAEARTFATTLRHQI